jgi:putative ATPase
VPKHLRDTSYPGAARLGHGKGYRYPHDDPAGVLEQQYPPDTLVGRRYYEPTTHGAEARVAERSERIRAILHGTAEPGTEKPGAEQHGTREHRTDEDGADERGAGEQGAGERGTGELGAGEDGAEPRSGTGDAAAGDVAADVVAAGAAAADEAANS